MTSHDNEEELVQPNSEERRRMIIYLDSPLLTNSCGQPVRSWRTYLTLHRIGFTPHTAHAMQACALTARFHPYSSSSDAALSENAAGGRVKGAVCFCCLSEENSSLRSPSRGHFPEASKYSEVYRTSVYFLLLVVFHDYPLPYFKKVGGVRTFLP